MTFHKPLQKVTFSGIAFDMNAATMVPQIKWRFIRKHHLMTIMNTPVCMSWTHCRRKRWSFCARGCYIKKFVQCSRRRWINEPDSDIRVAVVQCAASSLHNAVCYISGMLTKCLSPRIFFSFSVQSQIFELPNSHLSTTSVLKSLRCCYSTHDHRNGAQNSKIIIHGGGWFTPLKQRKLLQIYPLPSTRRSLVISHV